MDIPVLQPSRASVGRASAALFQKKFSFGEVRLGFLGNAWSLAKPYWVSEERAYARRMFALLLTIKFAGIWICVQQNHWYANFYAAIESREVDAFFKQVAIFALIAGGFIASLVSSHWVAESLKLRWRNWLVERTTSDWLTNRAYYRMQLADRPGTNPDQRIVEDLGLFAGHSINLIAGFLDVSVSLIAFTSILWSLSGTLTVGGIAIGGYMVFAVFGYTFLASWLTHKIGRPLVALLSANQNLESDFRYGLVRVRENAETVAFYRGEDREIAMLHVRWAEVVRNFREIMRRERAIGWFTHAHGQVSIVLPFLLAAPRYFTGQITFAQVMQVAAACGSVQACLNFFISSYGQIALWQATTERLIAFRNQLDEALEQGTEAVQVVRAGEGLVVRDLNLSLPDRRTLVSDLNLVVDAGKAVLIKGASGIGKSTMLRAVAGIWPHASGSVSLGQGEAFFVPQKPYLPQGTLREAAFYPAPPSADDDEVRRVLGAVRLGHLIDRLDKVDHWSLRLSGGEQQRLGFARIFLTRPQTIFLDEATSALDEETEGYLYQMLLDADWKPTIISIGHRSTLANYHDTTVELKRAA